MDKLPKEYEAMYEHIRLATPELEDYKEYAKNSKAPVSQEEFIDVTTFITARLIPKNLNLTSDEQALLVRHYMIMKLKRLTDALIENPE